VVLALVFNYGVYLYAAAQHGPEEGARLGLEVLTGHIVEQSLAVDNIFLFVLVFACFHIPPEYRHRVLFYGIIGALAFRAVFIALGGADALRVGRRPVRRVPAGARRKMMCALGRSSQSAIR
jgi:tellurite resistance protein TerC